MHYYKTTLRLAGSTLNEVEKLVSAPELLILRYLHGDDSCSRVSEVKNEKINLYAEKERLINLYNSGLGRKEQSVDQLFGALGTLPERLPPQLLDLYDIDGDGFDLYDPAKGAVTSESTKKAMKATAKQIDNRNRLLPAEEVNVADLME